jgi:hypothetical protein
MMQSSNMPTPKGNPPSPNISLFESYTSRNLRYDLGPNINVMHRLQSALKLHTFMYASHVL